MQTTSGRRWLWRLGGLALLLLVAAGALVARALHERAEHARLRAADLARAPVAAPRRPQRALPASRATSGADCLRGVVTDRGAPVSGMQVNAAEERPALSGACPCPHSATFCGCRSGLALLARQPRAGLVEAVHGTTTATDGTFALCGLEGAAPRLVWAEHGDGRLALPAADGPDRPAPGATARLEVVQGIPVVGVVLADREPVPDALVHAFVRPALSVRTTRTDGRGRFELSLPLEVVDLLVAAPDRAPQRFERRPTPGEPWVVELTAEAALEVRALHDGRPLPGAEVHLGAEPPVETDADGLARFPAMPTTQALKLRAGKGDLVGVARVSLLEATSRRVDVALRKGARVSGTVRDDQGLPRTGRVRGLGASAPAETDGEGRFVSGWQVPGTELHPVAMVEGCAESPYLRHEVGAAAAELTLTVACTETATGVVLDAEGRPIADALVKLVAPEHEESSLTDASGRFALHAPAGTWQLEVTHERYRPLTQPQQVPVRDLTLVLDAGGSIRGKVVREDGAGVADAEVLVVPALLEEALRQAEGPSARATTDAEGTFELNGLLAGRLYVSASAGALGTAVSDVVVLQPGEHREGLVLTFDARVGLDGTVRDERGRPIPGARVTWNPVDGRAALLGVLTDALTGRMDSVLKLLPSPSSTDAEGRFALRGLPVARVKVAISASGFGDAERTADRGERLEVVLQRTGGVVRGRVVDEQGHPLRQFELDGAAFTADDGRFEVRATAGEEVFTVTAPGFVRAHLQVTTMKGEARDVGDVRLRRGLGLTVEVRGPDGRPLEGARVVGTQAADGADCVTPTDGRCVLTPLLAEATTVEVRKEGFVPAHERVDPEALGTPLRVALEVAGARLRGRATNALGQPVAAATVALSGPVRRSVLTGPDGAFSAEALPGGRYCATLEVPGAPLFEWSTSATAGPQPSELQVGPVAGGARLVGSRAMPGRLLLVRGVAQPQECSELLRHATADHCEVLRATVVSLAVTGAFAVEGLPPGRWSVFYAAITDDGDDSQQEPTVLDLLPNETRRLD